MSLENGVTKNGNEDAEVAALISSLKDTLPDNGTLTSLNRARLRETAQKLSAALETPGETAQRIVYLVGWPNLLHGLEPKTCRVDFNTLINLDSRYTLPSSGLPMN